MKNIHIGTIIRAQLTKKKLSVVWLASQLGIKRPNCYRILRAGSLQTDLLLRISLVLNHDFFLILLMNITQKKYELSFL